MLTPREELEWQWELMILDLMEASKKALTGVGKSTHPKYVGSDEKGYYFGA